jgi:mycothiol synthase
MEEQNNLPQLVMFIESLEDLEHVSVPDGYTVRHFRDGDDKHWEKIIKASFNYECNFEKEIAQNENFKPEKVWFICDGDIPVATATAWYSTNWDKSVGYLHMVGMLPEYAGKSLGLKASLAAIHEMKHEGRSSSVLNTDDFRLPAIKTYLRLGYKPHFTHESHELRWKDILEKLK